MQDTKQLPNRVIACYNLERIQPSTYEPTKPQKVIIPPYKPMWYQCMMCQASEYIPESPIDAPSSNICKSTLCRMEFALLYSTTEKQFKENLEEIMKEQEGLNDCE